jgi:hypothetical protein
MEIALLPVRTGTISAEDKAALRDAGVVVIEHEAPETLRLLTPTAELGTSDLLGAAMYALVDSGHASTQTQAAFTHHVGALIRAKRKKAA